VEGGPARLLAHFREAFGGSPAAAYREWFRAQEELGRQGDVETARALADDLWEVLPGLAFESPEDRARFLHNVGVFFGSAGPAADLGRARHCYERALDHFSRHAEDGWRARALHNLASAIGNLGTKASEIEEAVALFHEALEWRTPEREIARGVTLHNLGSALRRLAGLDPARSAEHLAASASALREAVAIRGRHRLEEGLAASRASLEETLSRLQGPADGRFPDSEPGREG
jgi:tetratricopeptide (TPR) repeat protein